MVALAAAPARWSAWCWSRSRHVLRHSRSRSSSRPSSGSAPLGGDHRDARAVLAIVVAWAWLGESLNAVQLSGAAVTLAGVSLALSSR